MFKPKLNSFWDFFRFQFNILAVTGLRFDLADFQIKRKWLIVVNKVFFVYCVMTSVGNIVLMCLSILLLNQKVELKLRFITLFFANIDGVSKVLCFCLNSKAIFEIIEKLGILFQPNYDYLKIESRLISIFTKCATIVPRLLSIVPLAVTVFELVRGNWNPLFLNDLWYPFNPRDIRVYFFVYFNQITMGMVSISYSMGTDAIVTMIYAHINQQFIILSEEFICLKNNDPVLKVLINRHCRLVQ